MRQLITVLLFVAVMIPGNADAMEISIEDAVNMASENNLSLKQEAIEVKTLKRQTVAAFNSLIPEITGTAGLYRPNEASPYAAPGSDPEWALSLDLSAQLVINPAMFMAVRNTRLNYARGKISYEAAQRALERDVRKNYYALLLLAENIRLVESNLATAKRRWEREQNNFSYGSSSKLNLLKAQAGYENLKPALAGLKSQYLKAMYLFAVTLGIDDGTEPELVSKFPETDRLFGENGVPVFSESENPDVKVLEAALIHLRHTRATTAMAYMSPSLVIGANYNPAVISLNDASDPLGDWADGGGITVAVRIPLDSWLPVSKDSVALREMSDNIETMQLRLETLEKMAAVEIRTLVMDLDNALASIDAYKLNADLAGQVLDLTESAYEEGVVNFIDVEDATDQYNEARIDLLSGKLDYITAILDLEYAANVDILGENDED